MTDLERLAVAWDLWWRTSRAVARGLGLGPLVVGALLSGGMVVAAALRPMLA